jgi:transcriptional regulator GlxA family with amidase domain
VGLTLELIATLARWAVLDQSLPAADSESRPGGAARRADVERYVAELGHRFYEHATLDTAAAELGMSRRRFTTLFAETTGRTWADYVAALRIQYARKLLCETNRSVAAIAFECGYEELSSFYRAFKRQTGDSPGHWRTRQGKDKLPELQIDIARPAKTRSQLSQ